MAAMTSDQAEFLLQQVYLPQMQNERKATRRVIESVPANKGDYKPDPASTSALDLAWHIASSECFFINGVVNRKFEPGGTRPEHIKTSADVLKWYDENIAKATASVSVLKGDVLTQDLNFAGVFNLPAVAYLGIMNSHSIHHRGQLSAYLRPMGAKVPSIYGPSADEPIEMPAAAKA
jgi:uncharacterized damage-inducible protein DinB